MRKLRWIGSVAFVIAAVVGIWYWLKPSRPPIDTTVENYKRLKYNMTRDEVEAILGGPPGNYLTDRDRDWFLTGPLGIPAGYGQPMYWMADDGLVNVAFAPNGQAYMLGRTEVPPPRPIPIRLYERVERWCLRLVR